MSAKECYYINSHGPDTQAFAKGIAWLISNSHASGGWFAHVGLRNLEACARYPGMGALLALVKNKPHKAIISGVELELVTEKQIPYNGQNRPLLAAHSPKDYLDRLSSIPNISKMLVIPWGRDEINDWISYTNAVELGSTKPAQQSPSVNKVMLAALKDAHILMNPANGMVHFRNRDILVETVQIL